MEVERKEGGEEKGRKGERRKGGSGEDLGRWREGCGDDRIMGRERGRVERKKKK